MNPEEAKKFKLNICFSAAKVCEKGYLQIILELIIIVIIKINKYIY